MHSDDHLDDFARFYEREAQRLIRTVAVVTGEPALAEEAVAEAFARAWLRWPRAALRPRRGGAVAVAGGARRVPRPLPSPQESSGARPTWWRGPTRSDDPEPR